MNNFIVFVHEPDGRTETHSPEEIQQHQQHWKAWFEKWGPTGKFAGGSALSLNGNIVKGNPATIIPGIRLTGLEIIGGYLLLNADDLAEATAIAQSLPVFEFGGYVEVRELQKDN
jgi:hypothetical protein